MNSFYATKDNIKLFEVDNRGESLFVELVYPNDILEKDSIYSKDSKFKLDNFKSYITFVAIKNGEHNGIGYLTSNFDLEISKNSIDLKDLKDLIKNQSIN